MQLQSIYPVICTEKVKETATFYCDHFHFTLSFESDWYISLQSTSNPQQELAVMDLTHPSIPEGYRKHAAGVLINIEVEDVDSLYATLEDQGLAMALDLRSEEWGQRHFIVEDPSGLLVDVIQNIDPSPEFMQDFKQ